jgi:hypothetical protein
MTKQLISVTFAPGAIPDFSATAPVYGCYDKGPDLMMELARDLKRNPKLLNLRQDKKDPNNAILYDCRNGAALARLYDGADLIETIRRAA